MERLHGMDAGLLYMETPTTHTHTLKVAVFDPPPGETQLAFERAKAQIAERLPRLPGFRRRLVEIPYALHHPMWVEDPDFDLGRHVHRVAVAPPGGPRQMDEAIGRIASRPLDRGRPLWEVWLLEGLAGGRVAAVVKIHHAMADGVAAANLLAHVMSESPGSADPLPADSWAPEPLPRRGELVRDALLDHFARVGRVPRLVGRTAAGLAAFGRRRRELGRAAPRPLVDTPRTPFNRSLTAERCFASADLSLTEVKRVKEAGGVTVNDVLLAVSAGTLRRWLEARGALPDRPLVAEVPVSADHSAAPRLSGNRTSNLFAFLRTDLADPAERLKATHEATSAAKQLHEALGADMYGDWSEYAPPALYRFAMRQLAKHRIADRTRPPVNLIISNVRGPSAPLYWEGAPLRSIYSVGPILEGIGLNLTMWSYLDRVFVGALACPDRLDGLHEITQGLGAELDRLVAAIAPR